LIKSNFVSDADNYPNTATTIFEPRSSIGEAATKTTNLFDATQKLGVSYNLRKPGSGEWEAVVISFSEITAVSGAATYDMLAEYKTATTMGTNGAYGVMLLGNDGTGTATSLDTVFSTVSMAPIQTVITDGADFTLPALDFYLPEASLVTTGPSVVGVTQLPRPTLVVSQATDSASRANVLVDIDDDTAFTAATGWTLGASVVTVGLFDSTVPETPLVSTTYTAASPTALKQVEFIDVPHNVTLQPIAWVDLDSDGRLDTGEYYTFHHATKTTNDIAIVAADISLTAVNGVLDDASGFTFPPRTVTVDISMTNDTSSTYVAASDDAASGLTVTTAAGMTLAGATTAGALDISLTAFVYTNIGETISTSYVIPAKISMLTAGNDILAATEVFNVVLADTLIDFSDYGNLSYDATRAGLQITGVPAFTTVFGDNNAGAAYRVRLSVLEAANSETAFMDVSEAATAGTNDQEAVSTANAVTILGNNDLDLGGVAAFD
jgi:hypothetical protein